MTGIAPGPRALSEWFIIRQMDDEVLVYDLRNQNITSLNAFAAAVWHACDGQADPASIARRLATEGYAVADLAAITLALEMLAKAGLIEALPEPVKQPIGNSRREFARRLFGGGVALAARATIVTPAVVTILAPTPAHAASSGVPSSGCGGNGECVFPTPVCDHDTFSCVACISNSDCTDPMLPNCVFNECV